MRASHSSSFARRAVSLACAPRTSSNRALSSSVTAMNWSRTPSLRLRVACVSRSACSTRFSARRSSSSAAEMSWTAMSRGMLSWEERASGLSARAVFSLLLPGRLKRGRLLSPRPRLARGPVRRAWRGARRGARRRAARGRARAPLARPRAPPSRPRGVVRGRVELRAPPHGPHLFHAPSRGLVRAPRGARRSRGARTRRSPGATEAWRTREAWAREAPRRSRSCRGRCCVPGVGDCDT